MTPKEKAKYLIDKFYQTTPNEAWFNPPVGAIVMDYNAWEQAKQCALIAVDEILSLSKIASLRRDEVYMELEYWIEVKQEIEKL